MNIYCGKCGTGFDIKFIKPTCQECGHNIFTHDKPLVKKPKKKREQSPGWLALWEKITEKEL